LLGNYPVETAGLVMAPRVRHDGGYADRGTAVEQG
jgi:hypothetical protein